MVMYVMVVFCWSQIALSVSPYLSVSPSLSLSPLRPLSLSLYVSLSHVSHVGLSPFSLLKLSLSPLSLCGFLRVLRFPPPVKLSFHHHNHCLDMTLAVVQALSPNKPNLNMTLAVVQALSPNKPNQTLI